MADRHDRLCLRRAILRDDPGRVGELLAECPTLVVTPIQGPCGAQQSPLAAALSSRCSVELLAVLLDGGAGLDDCPLWQLLISASVTQQTTLAPFVLAPAALVPPILVGDGWCCEAAEFLLRRGAAAPSDAELQQMQADRLEDLVLLLTSWQGRKAAHRLALLWRRQDKQLALGLGEESASPPLLRLRRPLRALIREFLLTTTEGASATLEAQF